MPVRLSPPSRVAAVVLASALLLSASSARGGEDSKNRIPEPDRKAIAAFRLDLPTIEKVADANDELGKLVTSNPALKESVEKSGDARTLEESIARIESIPGARAALGRAGITPRTYILTVTTLVGAWMVAAAEDDGEAPENLPEEIARANVDFCREHRRELEELRPRLVDPESVSAEEDEEDADD